MTTQIWKDFNEQLLIFINGKVNNKEIAKDILQDVFIKIHQKIDTLKDPNKITSWIYQITRNTIIDYFRKNKMETVELPIENSLLEEIDENNIDFSKCILPFINQLSAKDQDILKKTAFGNLSQKKYAEQHQLSYSAAKSRVQRAKEKLKVSFVKCCQLQSDKYGNIISHTETDCSC